MDLRSRLRLARPMAGLQNELPDWYRISNAAQSDTTSDEVDIYLYGSIGGWWGIDATEFVHQVMALDAKQLNVHINSPGGSVFDGIAIFQALRNHKARIVTYVDSLAASAASFIAMAGDQRVISPYGSLMIHDAWGLAIGNAADMAKMAEELDRVSGTIAAIYAKRAGGERDEWRQAMRDETWYSADEAVESGLAHEVQEDEEKTGDSDASNAFDLSMYNYAGRDKAPPPRIPARAAVEPEGTPAVDTDDLMGRLIDSLSAAGWQKPPAQASAVMADPVPPAAEPEQPSNSTKEDSVSDLSTDVRSWLGLPEDADHATAKAAFDDLKAKADRPEPTPDPQQEATMKAQADKLTALESKLEMVTEQLGNAVAELNETRAQKAADQKERVLDAAIADGKIRVADRQSWADRYAKNAEVVTDVLASIPAGTAVPVAAVGDVTDPDEGAAKFSQSEYDRLFSTSVSTGKDA